MRSSSLKLGHARGVVVLAAARAGLAVSEYASKRVKRSLTGTGAATKDQVAMMVRTLLPGATEGSRDATDALAVAICHAHVREHDGPHRGGHGRRPVIALLRGRVARQGDGQAVIDVNGVGYLVQRLGAHPEPPARRQRGR